MRIGVISDIHGRTDRLAAAAAEVDLLICLGDLLVFLDYADPGRGIFADLFGRDAAVELIRLRTTQDMEGAGRYSAELWRPFGERRATVMQEAIDAQYRAMFAVMPPCLFTYGNVDDPERIRRLAPPHVRVLDGEAVTVGGIRFGFVGGGLRTRYRTPYELADHDYQQRVASLGPVDVLCSHIPPAIAELLTDVVARRSERGSRALLKYDQTVEPQLHVFGHVHNPAVAETWLGPVRLRNVGHFAATGRPWIVELDGGRRSAR